MPNDRPNPDELLARVRANEAAARRGRLKIFFGYAAGVGKTYSMLQSARRERDAGVDVVVGYVEPHGRRETEVLLEGLESLPTRSVGYRGVVLREFDLDAALARKPQLILVDELAHTNAEGSRHAKRWQDVEELLEAGCDVYTTLNVQHVESLNDIIAQITGTVVRETLPDAIIEKADDIELIDITPEELIERLQQGRVYVPQQAERALAQFFQKSNLAALRELSLRQAAQRLSRDVEAARQERSSQGPWATNERLLVSVGPSPTSAKLIRTTKRLAAGLGCDWLAIAVETSRGSKGTAQSRARVAAHLRLAEELGAETHMLVGDNVASTIIDFARTRNVTKIVVGKTSQPRWKRWISGSVVDEILEQSGDIDVYVIRGESEPTQTPQRDARGRKSIVWKDYLRTAGVVGLCSILGWVSHALRLSESNIVMLFLLGVVFVAVKLGRGPAIAAAIGSVLVFDFLFVPPLLTFTVHDAQYLITFAVMLIIGIVISTLAVRIREQLQSARELERRTAALFRLTRQLSEVAGSDFLIRIAGKQLHAIFDADVLVYIRSSDGRIELRFGEQSPIAKNEINAIVAQWVSEHDQIAGRGTDTLPNATALFVPLIGSRRTIGAIGLRPTDDERFSDPDQRHLLETCASLIALSLERDQSVLEAHEAQVRIETEQLRNALLSSVSHDLRTPLATIVGVSSSLFAGLKSDADQQHAEMLQSLVDESERLARLVDNLLDMTRLESGKIAINLQWQLLEELVGSSLTRLKSVLARHPVRVMIPAELPLLQLDGNLIEQLFTNLLENAARYSPEGTEIEINARKIDDRVEIRIADNGPGLPPGSEEQVFEKFFRGPTAAADGRRGVGLGLAICRGIVEAHEGRITARNRPGGGAEFLIVLPCKAKPPFVPLEEHSVVANS